MQTFIQFLSEESHLDRFSKDVDSHYERSKENPRQHIARDEHGNHAVSFELAHREGKVRLNGIEARIHGQGHASRVMKHLTGLADKHGAEMELTASPYGDEKTRLNHDQLHDFYTKHGFEWEKGYDPSLGYMVRTPKRNLR